MPKAKCYCCGEFVSDNPTRAKRLGQKYAATDAKLEVGDVAMVLCNICVDPFPNLRRVREEERVTKK